MKCPFLVLDQYTSPSEFFIITFGKEVLRNAFSYLRTGANEYGQLGDGTEKGKKYPMKVKQLQSEFVVSVSCGAHCTAAIAEPRENDGSMSTRRLWVWGQNQVYQVARLRMKTSLFL